MGMRGEIFMASALFDRGGIAICSSGMPSEAAMIGDQVEFLDNKPACVDLDVDVTIHYHVPPLYVLRH